MVEQIIGKPREAGGSRGPACASGGGRRSLPIAGSQGADGLPLAQGAWRPDAGPGEALEGAREGEWALAAVGTPSAVAGYDTARLDPVLAGGTAPAGVAPDSERTLDLIVWKVL